MSRNLKEDIVCLIILIIIMSALFYVAHISNNNLKFRIMQIEESTEDTVKELKKVLTGTKDKEVANAIQKVLDLVEGGVQ